MQRVVVWGFALVVAIGMAGTPRAEVPAPEAVVQTIADELASSIGARREALQKDHERLVREIDAILLPHFDIDYASLLVLGRNARSATPEQRSRFAKAFYDSIANRYADGLLNYTRGKVRVLPFKGELNDKRSIVRTEVALDDGKTVSVDYAFRKTAQGQWKAYDVIIEGISYIANYRNQVDAEIRASSLDALISRLETQGAEALDSMDRKAGTP